MSPAVAAPSGGALFQPFRALGYITDDIPFAVQRRGSQTFVTVSVGKAWQVRWPIWRRMHAALGMHDGEPQPQPRLLTLLCRCRYTTPTS